MNKELSMPVVIAAIVAVMVVAVAAYQFMNRPSKDMGTAEEYLRGQRMPPLPGGPAAPPAPAVPQPEKK